MRALGVDLGTRRIGLATCDSGGILASPLRVLERSGQLAIDHKAIAAVVVEEEIELVVVGLPIDLAGKKAIAAQNAAAEVAALATVVPVPVETYDERMTTAFAAKQMRASGGKSKNTVAGRRAYKQKIDAAAAAVILQGWLDSRP